MLLSIITINRNNACGLERTITSVASQSYRAFEYIVIDGNSSDHSKDIISKHDADIDWWVSEPDNGIYNAMNKGVSNAHGEYVLFLNSGDVLHDSNVIEQVMAEIKGGEADFYVGTILCMHKHPTQVVPPKQITASYLITSALSHPASFIRRARLAERPYKEDYKIVADWTFYIQELLYHNATYQRLDIIVTDFDMTGVSSTDDITTKAEKRRYLLTLFPEKLVDSLLLADIQDPNEQKRRKKIEMCFRQETALGCSLKMFRNSAKWLMHDILALLRR